MAISGYHPHKSGRASHHPLMAFVDECKMVINCRRDVRDIVLKLSLALKRREWFTGLWNASKKFSLPVEFSNA